ncbi:MAG: hypothetical protein JWR15_2252 [Prosthecobacter sp.]|nr:hypothetical protein [Prosthecobacter sp.]
MPIQSEETANAGRIFAMNGNAIAFASEKGYFCLMKNLTLAVDDSTFHAAELQAQRSGKSLSSLLLEFLGRFSAAGDSDFERLVQEEEALRANLRQKGRQFSAGDRLNRDELHDRHALR